MTGTILLTGGAGYIGSHTHVALVAAGHEVLILDDFSNARADVPDRLAMITGVPARVIRGSVLDRALLDRVFAETRIDAVVHFAALKAVGDSMARPLDYFETNIGGLTTLLQAMMAAGCRRLVFSSSATVYGIPDETPTPETAPRRAMNPYGWTKIAGEEILEQLAASDPAWAFGILRYFNPAGAHQSGLIGEDPTDIPNNLMPYIARVATGALPKLQVFGDDYSTPDGTGVRDYIHVSDLAAAHLLALEALIEQPERSLTMNCGYGRGFSVLEVLDAVDRVTNQTIERRLEARRAGDPAELVSDPSRIRETLPWQPKHADLSQIITHALQWERKLSDLRGE